MSFDKLLFLISTVRLTDIIDILIVSYIFYHILILIQGTRATQIIKGVLLVFVCSKLAQYFKLYTISWILNNTLTWGVVLVMILFQSELRRILEYIGTNKFFKKGVDADFLTFNKAMDDVVRASFSLAEKKIGALIVLERETGLKDIVETGIALNSNVSYELLMNIFIPNTPLHDGAVIISGESILAASCFLPLTDNKAISMELGTRHRAGLGISEKSDCIVIVVSEETGYVSVMEKGRLQRNVSLEYLRGYISKSFVFYDKNEKISFKESFKNALFRFIGEGAFTENYHEEIKEDIKEGVIEEIKEEVKQKIKEEIREEVSEIIENQGDKIERKTENK